MIYAWTDTSMLQFPFDFLQLLSTIDFEFARLGFQRSPASYVAAPCLFHLGLDQLTSAQTFVICCFIHARISNSFRHSCSTGQLAYGNNILSVSSSKIAASLALLNSHILTTPILQSVFMQSAPVSLEADFFCPAIVSYFYQRALCLFRFS